MTILTGFLPLGQLADLANVSYIIAFALVSYSTFIIRRDYPNAKEDYHARNAVFANDINIIIYRIIVWYSIINLENFWMLDFSRFSNLFYIF